MAGYSIEWDKQGEHYYETGTDHGVVYPMDDNGDYGDAEAWNGLTSVDESPSGAEAEKIYADNGVYLTLMSAEEFGGNINAYTYPDGFKKCNGEAAITKGVSIGQQKRYGFGFSYRSRRGNDVDEEIGHLIHIWYGCKASPSEKSYSTVNDSPEAIEFSWEVTTTPIEVKIGDTEYRKTAQITIDTYEYLKGLTGEALTAAQAKLNTLYNTLYGTAADDTAQPPTAEVKGRLPLPAEIYTLLS